jgi:hypothetical protein
MKPVDHPYQQWRRQREHKQRVAGGAVVGKVTDGIAQWYEHVKVRKRTGDCAPQYGPVTNLAAKHGFADRRA